MDLLKKVAVMVFIFLAIPSLVFGAVSGFVTLKYGQKNNSEVRELQTFLKSQGLYNGPVTGNFLTLTRASLKNFQKKYGLKQSGLLDESTLKKITEIQNLQNNSQSTNNLQENQTTINTSSSLDITKLPLGDNKYSTTSAQRGYIYLCSVGGGMEGGAQVKGPWITGDTWDSTKKTQVSGDVSWPNAKLNIKTSGETRIFTGNGLPVNHNTGQYPINSSDPAYKYDKNPNSISEQNTSITVPLKQLLQFPYCFDSYKFHFDFFVLDF
jgi:peptidoglycan hydrolase-like protein with peptidoglycan-binding domain